MHSLTGPFQLWWKRGYIHSSCYYHHQIGTINLTLYHIFPWLCAWDVCYIIFCDLLHIYPGKTGIFFWLLLCSLWWVQIFGYVLACRSCSFVCTLHHLIIIIVQNLSKVIELECVIRLSIFSQLFIIQYIGLCVFNLPISLVMIERIYTLSYYHHQIGSVNYYPLFRVRSWNNGMRCMSLYILTEFNMGFYIRPSIATKLQAVFTFGDLMWSGILYDLAAMMKGANRNIKWHFIWLYSTFHAVFLCLVLLWLSPHVWLILPCSFVLSHLYWWWLA